MLAYNDTLPPLNPIQVPPRRGSVAIMDLRTLLEGKPLSNEHVGAVLQLLAAHAAQAAALEAAGALVFLQADDPAQVSEHRGMPGPTSRSSAALSSCSPRWSSFWSLQGRPLGTAGCCLHLRLSPSGCRPVSLAPVKLDEGPTSATPLGISRWALPSQPLCSAFNLLRATTSSGSTSPAQVVVGAHS